MPSGYLAGFAGGDVRPVALMDLRPLVPWVFSQLGEQPDGVGRPLTPPAPPARARSPPPHPRATPLRVRHPSARVGSSHLRPRVTPPEPARHPSARATGPPPPAPASRPDAGWLGRHANDRPVDSLPFIYELFMAKVKFS